MLRCSQCHLNATKGYVQVPALNTNSLEKCGVAGALGLCGVVVSLNELLSGDIEFKSMSCLLATWHELTKSNKIGKHSTLFSKEEKNLQYPSIQDNGFIRINDSIPSLEPVLKGSRESDKRHSVVRMIGGSEFEWRTWKGDKGTRGHQGSRVSGVLMQLIQAKSLEPFPNVYQWTWHDRLTGQDDPSDGYLAPIDAQKFRRQDQHLRPVSGISPSGKVRGYGMSLIDWNDPSDGDPTLGDAGKLPHRGQYFHQVARTYSSRRGAESDSMHNRLFKIRICAKAHKPAILQEWCNGKGGPGGRALHISNFTKFQEPLPHALCKTAEMVGMTRGPRAESSIVVRLSVIASSKLSIGLVVVSIPGTSYKGMERTAGWRSSRDRKSEIASSRPVPQASCKVVESGGTMYGTLLVVPVAKEICKSMKRNITIRITYWIEIRH
ncbi:hypothetical protein V8B97DRAFT_2111432 [Scleroderma yunnanense]